MTNDVEYIERKLGCIDGLVWAFGSRKARLYEDALLCGAWKGTVS